jgi:hypothetical protein
MQELVSGHGIEKSYLAGKIAEVLLDFGPFPVAVIAVNGAGTFVGVNKAQEVPNGCGFPCAVGPEIAKHLSPIYREGKVKNAFTWSVLFSEIGNCDHRFSYRSCSPSSLPV